MVSIWLRKWILMNSSCLLYTPNSGNSYYFRSRIPRDLSDHFGGLKEFRVSLKCAIKSHANRITKILNQIVSEIYEEIRHGMKSLEIKTFKRWICLRSVSSFQWKISPYCWSMGKECESPLLHKTHIHQLSLSEECRWEYHQIACWTWEGIHNETLWRWSFYTRTIACRGFKGVLLRNQLEKFEGGLTKGLAHPHS